MIYYETESGSLVLMHYGVKGMKWRKNGGSSASRSTASAGAEEKRIRDQELLITRAENETKKIAKRSKKMASLRKKVTDSARKSLEQRKSRLKRLKRLAGE